MYKRQAAAFSRKFSRKKMVIQAIGMKIAFKIRLVLFFILLIVTICTPI